MALPDFSMRQLLEAGVHFGHQTHRWNPKMDKFIFGKRNNIHILDLSQTVPLMHNALKQISDTVAKGGRVLFVGTKRAASEPVADAARRSAQYYVNARWLGGMLTNWKTMSKSIKRLRELEELLSTGDAQYTKKELLGLTRERDKLERALGGIKDMGGTPDLIFVIDTNKEAIAIQEARKLKIPVCAVLDSNSDTDSIDHPIPGNDDAARAIALYCDLVAKAAIDGIARQQGASGVDLGAQTEAPRETVLDDVSAAASGAASTATDAISAAAASAAQMAGQAASGASKAAAPAAESAKDTASAAAETAGDAASSAAETAKDAASSAVAAAGDAASSATETAKDVAASATDAAKTAAADPAATAASAGDAAKEAASTAADTAKSAAGKVAEVASGAASTAAGVVSAVVSDVADKAKEAAAAAGPMFTAPAGDGDTLTDIKGIGPVAEGQLKEQGITTFKQIAELTAEEIAKVDENMPFSAAQIEDWQAQAKEKV